MRTYFADIIPNIQRFSQQLDNLTLLTSYHWVVLDDIETAKLVSIFRENGELLISKDGKVEKGRWEYLGFNSLLMEWNNESYLFKRGYFDENILALKVDGKEEYVFFVNEINFEAGLNSIQFVVDYLKKANSEANTKRSKPVAHENLTKQNYSEAKPASEKINNVIKAIDEELIARNKDYLTLGQANQLLVNHGILLLSEKFNKVLKGMLEKNEIPHAYQTEGNPKQWRIPLSKEGKTKRSLANKKSLKKKKDLLDSSDSELLDERMHDNTETLKVSEKKRSWIILIIILLILIVIGYLNSDNFSSDSGTYYINTTTYAATSKGSFDEMFEYCIVRDEQALLNLIYSGEIVTLNEGTEVILVGSYITYCIVKERGSRKHLWVVTEHISRN